MTIPSNPSRPRSQPSSRGRLAVIGTPFNEFSEGMIAATPARTAASNGGR